MENKATDGPTSDKTALNDDAFDRQNRARTIC